MAVSGITISSLAGATLGIASHLCYFIRGERDTQSPRILATAIITPFLLFGSLQKFDSKISILYAVKITAVTSLSYLAALTLSIIIYRLFFHPLRKFPGPFTYKVTKWAHMANIASDSRNHIHTEQLRSKYGNIVRIGPNELSITSANGLREIFGARSKCVKSPFYQCLDGSYPTMLSAGYNGDHERRRKIWDRGFNVKALKTYESRVLKYVNQLTSQLQAWSGRPLNATRWLNFFAFDVMGDLAFGKSFNMLESGDQHYALKILHDAMAPVGILRPIAWILPILIRIPGAAGGDKVFFNFVNSQIAARKEKEPEVPDVMSWLIDAGKNGAHPSERDPSWLSGDTGLLILAGSDTTSSTLTHIVYHLAAAPHVVSKLREELKSIYHPESATEVRDIQDAKYLNGVINEGLRLHHPAPSGFPRLTPQEGIMIDGTFIPGNVIVSSPFYSLGRLESCYQHAEEFLPERWVDKPELILDRSAFIPFGAGPRSCVGKQLALIELRTVIARLVMQFDIQFAPGEDGSNLLNNSKDVFTMDVASLMLIFNKRS